MSMTTLSSGTHTGVYMPMTMAGIDCPAPVLASDFDSCRIPGGSDFWHHWGFFSPGKCFNGYRALCTQTSLSKDEWPIQPGETVVRCIPETYDCNMQGKDPRFATTDFGGTILSVPAFEIRWRSQDLETGTNDLPAPGIQPLPLSTPTLSSKSSTWEGFTSTHEVITTLQTVISTSSLSANREANLTTSEIASALSSPPPLSSGSRVGVVIASVAIFVIVAVAVYFWFKKHTSCDDKENNNNSVPQDTAEMNGDLPMNRNARVLPVELASKSLDLQELASDVQTSPRVGATSMELSSLSPVYQTASRSFPSHVMEECPTVELPGDEPQR